MVLVVLEGGGCISMPYYVLVGLVVLKGGVYPCMPYDVLVVLIPSPIEG